MTLHDELHRLTCDLRLQRSDLEQLIEETNTSSKTTEELHGAIGRLRERLEALEPPPGQE